MVYCRNVSEFVPVDTTEANVELLKKETPEEVEQPEMVEEVVEEIVEEQIVDILVEKKKKPKKKTSITVEAAEVPDVEWDIEQIIEKEVTVESTGYEVEITPVEAKPAEVTITTESIVTKPEIVTEVKEIELKRPMKKVEEEKHITIIQEVVEESKRHDIIIEAKTVKGTTKIHIRKAPEHADEHIVENDDESVKEFQIPRQRVYIPNVSLTDTTPMTITTTHNFESAEEQHTIQPEGRSASANIIPNLAIAQSETLLHEHTKALRDEPVYAYTPDKQMDTLHTIQVEEMQTFEHASSQDIAEQITKNTKNANMKLQEQTHLYVADTMANEQTIESNIEQPSSSRANIDVLSSRAVQVVSTHYDEKESQIEMDHPSTVRIQSLTNVDMVNQPVSIEVLSELGPDERSPQTVDVKLLPQNAFNVEVVSPHDVEGTFTRERTIPQQPFTELISQQAMIVTQTDASVKEGDIEQQLIMHPKNAHPHIDEVYETIIEDVIVAVSESELVEKMATESKTTSSFTVINDLMQLYDTPLESEEFLIIEEIVTRNATPGDLNGIRIPEITETMTSESVGDQPKDNKDLQQGKVIHDVQSALTITQPIIGDTESMFTNPIAPEFRQITPLIIPETALQVQDILVNEGEQQLTDFTTPEPQKVASGFALQETVNVLQTMTGEMELPLSENKLPKGQKLQQKPVFGDKRKAATVTFATVNEKELNIEDFVYDMHKAIPEILEQTAMTIMHVHVDEKEDEHLIELPNSGKAEIDLESRLAYFINEMVVPEKEAEFVKDTIAGKVATHEFELHNVTVLQREHVPFDKEAEFVSSEMSSKYAQSTITPLQPLEVVSTKPEEFANDLASEQAEDSHANVNFAETIAAQTMQTIVQQTEGLLELSKPRQSKALQIESELIPLTVTENVDLQQTETYSPDKRPSEVTPNVELVETRTIYIDEIVYLDSEQAYEPLKPLQLQNKFDLTEDSFATEVYAVIEGDKEKEFHLRDAPDQHTLQQRRVMNIYHTSEQFAVESNECEGRFKITKPDEKTSDMSMKPCNESLQVNMQNIVDSTGEVVQPQMIVETAHVDLLPQLAMNIVSVQSSENPIAFRKDEAVPTKVCLERTEVVHPLHAMHVQETLLEDSKADFEVAVIDEARAKADFLPLESYSVTEIDEAQKEAYFEIVSPSEHKSEVIFSTREHITVAHPTQHDDTDILEQFKPVQGTATSTLQPVTSLNINEVVTAEGECPLETEIQPRKHKLHSTLDQLRPLDIREVITDVQCSDLPIAVIPSTIKAQPAFIELTSLANEEIITADTPGTFRPDAIHHDTAHMNVIPSQQLIIDHTIATEIEADLPLKQQPETKNIEFDVVLATSLTAEAVTAVERETMFTATPATTQAALVDVIMHENSVRVCMTSAATDEVPFTVETATERTASVAFVPRSPAVTSLEVIPHLSEGHVETDQLSVDVNRARVLLDTNMSFTTTTDVMLIESEAGLIERPMPMIQQGSIQMAMPNYRSLSVQQVTHAQGLGEVVDVWDRRDVCTPSSEYLPNEALTVAELEGQDEVVEMVEEKPQVKQVDISVVATQPIAVQSETVVDSTTEFVAGTLPARHTAKPDITPLQTIAIAHTEPTEHEGRFSPDKPILQAATTDLTRQHAIAVFETTPVHKESSFPIEQQPSTRSVDITIPSHMTAISVEATMSSEVPEGVMPLEMNVEMAHVDLVLSQEITQASIEVGHEKEEEFTKKKVPLEHLVYSSLEADRAIEVTHIEGLRQPENIRTMPMPKGSTAQTELIPNTTVAVSNTEILDTVGVAELRKLPQGETAKMTVPMTEAVSITSVQSGQNANELIPDQQPATIEAKFTIPTQHHMVVQSTEVANKESPLTEWILPSTFEAIATVPTKAAITVEETPIHLKEGFVEELKKPTEQKLGFELLLHTPLEVETVSAANREGDLKPDEVPIEFTADIAMKLSAPIQVIQTTAENKATEFGERQPLVATAKRDILFASNIMIEETVAQEREGASPEKLIMQPHEVDTLFTTQLSIQVTEQTLPIAHEDLKPDEFPQEQTAQQQLLLHKEITVESMQPEVKETAIAPFKKPESLQLDFTVPVHEHTIVQLASSNVSESDFVPKSLPSTEEATTQITTSQHITIRETVSGQFESELMPEKTPITLTADVAFIPKKHRTQQETLSCVTSGEFDVKPERTTHAGFTVPTDEHIIVEELIILQAESTIVEDKPKTSQITDFTVGEVQAVISQQVVSVTSEGILEEDRPVPTAEAKAHILPKESLAVSEIQAQIREGEVIVTKPDEANATQQLVPQKSIDVREVIADDKEGHYQVEQLPETKRAGFTVPTLESVAIGEVIPHEGITEVELTTAPEKTANIWYDAQSHITVEHTQPSDLEDVFYDAETPTDTATFSVNEDRHIVIQQTVAEDQETEFVTKRPKQTTADLSIISEVPVEVISTMLHDKEVEYVANKQPEGIVIPSEIVPAYHSQQEQVIHEEREEHMTEQKRPTERKTSQSFVTSDHVAVSSIEATEREDTLTTPKQPRTTYPSVSFDTRDHITIEEAMSSVETVQLPALVMKASEVDVHFTESHHVLVRQTVTEITTTDFEAKQPRTDKATDFIEPVEPIEIIELVTDFEVEELPKTETIEAVTATPKEQKVRKEKKETTVTIEEEEDTPEETAGVTIKKTVKKKKSVRFAESGGEEVEEVTEVLHTFSREDRKVGPLIEEVTEEHVAGPQPTPIIEEAEEEAPVEQPVETTIVFEEVISETVPEEQTYKITEPQEEPQQVQISVTMKKPKEEMPVEVESVGDVEMTITEVKEQPVEVIEKVVETEEPVSETIVVTKRKKVKKGTHQIVLESQTAELDVTQETHEEFAVRSEDVTEVFTSQEVTISKKVKATKVESDVAKEEILPKIEEAKPVEVESQAVEFTVVQEIKRDVTVETVLTQEETPEEFTTVLKPRKESIPKEEPVAAEVTLKPKPRKKSVPVEKKEKKEEEEKPEQITEVIVEKTTIKEHPIEVESSGVEFTVTQLKVQEIEESTGTYREVTIEVASEGEERPQEFKEFEIQKVHEIDIVQEEFTVTKPIEAIKEEPKEMPKKEPKEETKLVLKKKKSIPKVIEEEKPKEAVVPEEDTTVEIKVTKKPVVERPVEVETQAVEMTVIQEKPQEVEVVTTERPKEEKIEEIVTVTPKKKISLKEEPKPEELPKEEPKLEESPKEEKIEESIILKPKRKEALIPVKETKPEEELTDERPILIETQDTSVEVVQTIEEPVVVETCEKPVEEVSGKAEETALIVEIQEPREVEEKPVKEKPAPKVEDVVVEKVVLKPKKKKSIPKEEPVKEEDKAPIVEVTIEKRPDEKPTVEVTSEGVAVTVVTDKPQEIVVEEVKREDTTEKQPKAPEIEEVEKEELKLKPKRKPSLSKEEVKQTPEKIIEETVQVTIKKESIEPEDTGEVEVVSEVIIEKPVETKPAEVEADKKILIKEEVPVVEEQKPQDIEVVIEDVVVEEETPKIIEEKPQEATLKIKRKKSIPQTVEEQPKVEEEKPQEATVVTIKKKKSITEETPKEVEKKPVEETVTVKKLKLKKPEKPEEVQEEFTAVVKKEEEVEAEIVVEQEQFTSEDVDIEVIVESVPQPAPVEEEEVADEVTIKKTDDEPKPKSKPKVIRKAPETEIVRKIRKRPDRIEEEEDAFESEESQPEEEHGEDFETDEVATVPIRKSGKKKKSPEEVPEEEVELIIEEINVGPDDLVSVQLGVQQPGFEEIQTLEVLMKQPHPEEKVEGNYFSRNQHSERMYGVVIYLLWIYGHFVRSGSPDRS